MAIPIYLQQFKAAGVYRVVFDKSTMLNEDTTIMRLVVGYSEKGPFNVPVLVRTASDFIQRFGGINKKLERRGIYFHRLALQMLNKAPIICLNLKKFDGETVDGATISTTFNPDFHGSNIIDTVELRVEDIYDKTRFWELKAENLNEIKSVDGESLDGNYINLAVTDTNKASASFFIRKANGSKVSGYNITVNDWYSDKQDEMPEWLEKYKNHYISDFFAEIYLFKGEFTPKQVLASETLKNYFVYDSSEKKLKLAKYVIDAYGDPVDTLDALALDDSSNLIGHYVGCLIPYFVNKQGSYISLDIAFNQDYDVHAMMMSFNVDLLDEGVNIDLSGKSQIPVGSTGALTLDNILNGTAKVSVLGNNKAPIAVDAVEFSTNVAQLTKTSNANEDAELIPIYKFKEDTDNSKIKGTMYLKEIKKTPANDTATISLVQIENDKQKVDLTYDLSKKEEAEAFKNALRKLQVEYTITSKDTVDKSIDDNKQFDINDDGQYVLSIINEGPLYYDDEDPFENGLPIGPEKVVTSLSRLNITVTDAVEEANAIYSFDSYSAPEEAIHYGSGTVEVISQDDTSATVKVKTNEPTDNTPADQAAAFVGKKFTVNSLDTTNRIQLFENGNAIDVWVKVEEANPIYSFTSWSAAQNGIQYGSGTVEVLSYAQDKTSAIVKVLTNEPTDNTPDDQAAAFVNKVFTVKNLLALNSGRIQLYEDEEAIDVWVEVEKENAIYSFDSYSAPEVIHYGSGRVEVLSQNENGARVKVLTNEPTDNTPADQAAAFVGKEFTVNSLDTNSRIQLFENGNAIDVWVEVELVSPKVDPEPATVTYEDKGNMKVSLLNAETLTTATYVGTNFTEQPPVYGSSLTTIKENDWTYSTITLDGLGDVHALINKNLYDRTLATVLKVGDQLIGADENGNSQSEDGFYNIIYVQQIGVGDITYNGSSTRAQYIILSGTPLEQSLSGSESSTSESSTSSGSDNIIIRIDSSLCQEIGEMYPTFLKGYTYKNEKPVGTGMAAKVAWQEFILSALTEYKGIRTGLLNKSEIDYRYVIDTFESFPVEGLKKELTYLCAQKQSAFAICNLPSISSFVKCPYASFTDQTGIFNAEYVVAGSNKKKAAARTFSLPSENEGASFGAFYTPLKFSDGYIDTIIPSAGLVSNLFIEKYMSRQPYYIVAGPNYGVINASGLVGPDYKYSKDELNILEPYGFNCMVYKPSFGTFINANQTAKQTPLSALSRVNVRELVIYLQDEIEKVLQAYQWEFNNSRTRNAILDRANQICALIASNGGIQTYLNVMDESNNTPEIIDNEMAILSTMIEPGFGCGKMVHELTLYRTGQMSSQVIE